MIEAETTGESRHLLGLQGSRNLIPTPALVLDIDRLDRNIATMAQRCRDSGVGLRPHAKTHKSIDIAKRQIAAGAVGVCCATLAEAEALVGAGIPGVLLTSPMVTPPKIERLVALNRSATDLMIVADDPANVDQLASATRQSVSR